MHSSELFLDTSLCERVKTWLRETSKGFLVITASQRGCGITSMIECFVRELSIDPVWIHQPIRAAKSFLEDATKNRRTALGLKKVLVIDPFDAVCVEPSCATDLVEFLKKGSCAIPIILTGHYLRVNTSKVQDILKKVSDDRVTSIHFPPLDDTKIIEFLGSGGENLWLSSGKDLRNSLQAKQFGGGMNATKDQRCDGFDAITSLVTSVPKLSLRDGARLVEGDASMIAGGIFENYPSWSTFDACTRISNSMSAADLFEKAMYSKNAWVLSGPQSVCVAGVTLERPAKPLKTMQKYGTVWSRENNKKTKEKTLKTASLGVPGLGAEDLGCLRCVMQAALKKGELDVLVSFAKHYGADTLLSLMRLWKSNYALTTHKKVTSALTT